jgi:hypothetical protein
MWYIIPYMYIEEKAELKTKAKEVEKAAQLAEERNQQLMKVLQNLNLHHTPTVPTIIPPALPGVPMVGQPRGALNH